MPVQILWKLNEGEGKFVYDQSEPQLPHANGEIVGKSFSWTQATEVSYIPAVQPASEVSTPEPDSPDDDSPDDEDLSPVDALDAATILLQAVADICSTHTELHTDLGVKWSLFSWSKSSASSTLMLVSILQALTQESCGKDHDFFQDAKTKAISNALQIFYTHFAGLSKPPLMTSPVKERAAAVLRPFLKSSDHGSLAALQSQALELIFCKSIMPIVCPEPKDRLEALIFLVKQDAESAGREFLRRLVSR